MLGRKGHMKKLIFAVIVLSIGYLTLAKADTETVTPKEFAMTVASVPGKLASHISMEIEKTKEYQKNQWFEFKSKMADLKAKFSTQ